MTVTRGTIYRWFCVGLLGLVACLLAMQVALSGNEYAWMVTDAAPQATLPDDPDAAFKRGLLAAITTAPAIAAIGCAWRLEPGTTRGFLIATGGCLAVVSAGVAMVSG